MKVERLDEALVRAGLGPLQAYICLEHDEEWKVTQVAREPCT